MLEPSVIENMRAVFDEYGRNGLCLKVLVDRDIDVGGDRLVPHKVLCLTTPLLLEESGIAADIDATNDLDDHYQYTLWLPDEDPGTLVGKVKAGFRGPFPKKEVSDDWTTEDLRGLQRP